MCIFMTIRFRGGSRSPVTPGIWVFVTSQWMIVIDYLHVVLHSGCSRGPGSATGIIVIIHFLYVYMYPSVSVQPPGTGGRLGVHRTFRRRSMTTYGRLMCFQHTSSIAGVRFYLSVIFIAFVKVDLE